MKNQTIKIILFIMLLLAIFTGCNKENYQNIAEADFKYAIIETEATLIGDKKYPPLDWQFAFNSSFILPENWDYSFVGNFSLLLTSNHLSNASSEDKEKYFNSFYISIDDYAHDMSNQLIGDEWKIQHKEAVELLFKGEEKKIIQYHYDEVNRSTVFVRNKNNSNYPQISDCNADISYYNSKANKTIAVVKLTYSIKSSLESDSYSRTIMFYYREDIPYIMVSAGADNIQNPSSSYGLNIIDSLKIIKRNSA